MYRVAIGVYWRHFAGAFFVSFSFPTEHLLCASYVYMIFWLSSKNRWDGWQFQVVFVHILFEISQMKFQKCVCLSFFQKTVLWKSGFRVFFKEKVLFPFAEHLTNDKIECDCPSTSLVTLRCSSLATLVSQISYSYLCHFGHWLFYLRMLILRNANSPRK